MDFAVGGLLDLLLLQATSVVAQPAAAPAVGRPAVVPW